MPSSQNGIGAYSQTLNCVGFQQIDISAGAVTGLTLPAVVGDNPVIVLVQATVGGARFRFDGTNPTVAIGQIITENNILAIVLTPEEFPAMKFIRNGADATILEVQYFVYAAQGELTS